VVKVIEQLFEDCDGNIQMQTEFAEWKIVSVVLKKEDVEIK
jgi:hypothetical protein